MAAHDEINEFVREGLSAGVPRQQLAAALAEAGWGAAPIRTALGRFAEVTSPIPVPRPRAYLEARDAFLYLLLFGSLNAVAFNAGSLIFDLINYWIPDPAAAGATSTGALAQSVRWAVSLLIVATPVWLYVTSLVARDVRRDPIKRASKVRKWIGYLTMLIAASVLIGDVTALVYSLLGGELTSRFALKAVVVAVIAGGVFGSYRSDLAADEEAVAS